MVRDLQETQEKQQFNVTWEAGQDPGIEKGYDGEIGKV